MSDVESYRLSRTKLFYGNSAVRVQLNSAITGPVGLNGLTNIHRDRVLPDDGAVGGLTADVVNAGFSMAVPMRLGPVLKAVAANRKGFLVMIREDSGYGQAMPVIVAGVPITAPAGGIVGASITFRQSVGGAAVLGSHYSGAGARQVPTGSEGYWVKANAVTRETGNFTMIADQYAVVGPSNSLLAEGS